MKPENISEERMKIIEKEIEEENAFLPLPENPNFRIVNDEVALEKVGLDLDHYPFVYVADTDRTHFVLTVTGRIVNRNEEDHVDKAILIFEKGFTEEFAKEIKIEIAKLFFDVLPKYHAHDDGVKVWIKYYLDATPEIIRNLKEYIIL